MRVFWLDNFGRLLASQLYEASCNSIVEIKGKHKEALGIHVYIYISSA